MITFYNLKFTLSDCEDIPRRYSELKTSRVPIIALDLWLQSFLLFQVKNISGSCKQKLEKEERLLRALSAL